MRFTKDAHALEVRVACWRIPGSWRTFENGSHRQFKTETDEYLNFWPSTGRVTIQNSSGGPLARRLMKLTAMLARRPPSVVHTVKAASKPLSDLALASPHDSMDPGWRRSTRGIDVSALNERQARFREIVAGLPSEAAVAELILSGVRHAVDYLSEREIHDALNTVATKVHEADYKWVDLYATIASSFQAERYDGL